MKKLLAILVYLHIPPVMFFIINLFVGSQKPLEAFMTGYGFTVGFTVACLLGYLSYKLFNVDPMRMKEPKFLAESPLWSIQKERLRQINDEHFTPERDNQYINGELADAAAMYATDPDTRERLLKVNPEHVWPQSWSAEWWKPGNYTPGNWIGPRRRELEKAGALIVAEMERLDRIIKFMEEEDAKYK